MVPLGLAAIHRAVPSSSISLTAITIPPSFRPHPLTPPLRERCQIKVQDESSRLIFYPSHRYLVTKLQPLVPCHNTISYSNLLFIFDHHLLFEIPSGSGGVPTSPSPKGKVLARLLSFLGVSLLTVTPVNSQSKARTAILVK